MNGIDGVTVAVGAIGPQGEMGVTGATGTTGATSPKSIFEFAGSVGMGFSKQTGMGTVNVDHTAAIWYFTGTADIVLPLANTCGNRVYTIVNRSNASLNISAYIDLSGARIEAFTANTSIEVVSDGADW